MTARIDALVSEIEAFELIKLNVVIRSGMYMVTWPFVDMVKTFRSEQECIGYLTGVLEATKAYEKVKKLNPGHFNGYQPPMVTDGEYSG